MKTRPNISNVESKEVKNKNRRTDKDQTLVPDIRARCWCSETQAWTRSVLLESRNFFHMTWVSVSSRNDFGILTREISQTRFLKRA